MPVRGIRGATVVKEDDPDQILEATRQLLKMILQENPDIAKVDITSAIFTMTDDLSSVYPAKAAREMGWIHVPLLCTMEISVPGSLEKCISVLLHWNTDLPQSAIQHVYLGKAETLRPDLARSD